MTDLEIINKWVPTGLLDLSGNNILLHAKNIEYVIDKACNLVDWDTQEDIYCLLIPIISRLNLYYGDQSFNIDQCIAMYIEEYSNYLKQDVSNLNLDSEMEFCINFKTNFIKNNSKNI